MHHILKEKMNVKCCFILPSLPTVSAILSQAYKHLSCPSGKLMDGTRATRENRKKREKWITSRGHPHFPEISERMVAYLLNFHPEFPVFSSKW